MIRLKRNWIWGILALVVFTVVVYLVRIQFHMPDFHVFHRAGGRFLAGTGLYLESDGYFSFKYMPISAALFVPFAIWPMPVAEFLWLTVIVGSLFGMVAVSWRLTVRDGDSWKVLILPLLLIMTKYYGREMEVGQINATLSLLVLGALWGMQKQKNILAGILLALAIMIKPYPVVFIPYLLIKRKFTVTGAAVGGVVVAFFLPVLRYGWAGNLELLKMWVKHLSGSTESTLLNIDNNTLYGMYSRWFGIEEMSLVRGVVFVTIAVLGVLFLYAITRSPRHPEGRYSSPDDGIDRGFMLEFAALMVLFHLIPATGWFNGFLTSTLGIMLVLSHRKEFPRWLWWVTVANFVSIGASLFDLMRRPFYTWFMDISILTLNFLFLILILLWLRTRSVRVQESVNL